METPYTLTQIDTRDADAVCAVVVAIGEELYGDEASSDRVRELFQDVTDIFEGRLEYFQKMDTVYHNLEHTLQATLCWVRMLRNYQLYSERAKITADFFQMGLVAVLLHDIGYLKEEHDEYGTGAKFTFVHERRSCELAQIYLAELGKAGD